MDELYTLVRNIAVILLLASFIEMMLPSKSMQSFVRLVMGLFVISAILTPVSSLLRMPLEMNIPAWTDNGNNDMPVLASGEESSRIGSTAVQEQFKMILENQIKAIALNVPGVENADIKIEMSGGTALTDQPQIEHITIHISSDSREIKPIEEVVIGNEITEEKPKEKSPLASEVQNKVATFMQISMKKISVFEVEQ